jgi:ATP-dependent exoDNAse (exonuclease V) beta subunit
MADEIKMQSGLPQYSASENGERLQQLAEPIAIDFTAQRRFSVSRLSGQIESAIEEPISFLPFSEEDQIDVAVAASGTDLGNLVHQVLARIDFADLARTPVIRNETIRTTVEHCLKPSGNNTAELIVTAVELIEQFQQSARAADLLKAKSLYRELEFQLAWPPEKSPTVQPGQGSAAESLPRYIQGYIDCLYQDAAGHWRLFDYKTNLVTTGNAASLAAQFELQLGVYALAVEQILKHPPAELTVHFLRSSLEHSFPWDAAARQRTIDRVNQAMKSSVMSHEAVSIGGISSH